MGKRAGKLVGAWVVALSCAALPAAAQAGKIRDAVEDVSGAQVVRYDARDDQGTVLDGLDVVQVGPGRYAGVHHAIVGGRFQARVATSTDLVTWKHSAILESDAAMPSIARVRGGGFVVAVERGSTLRVLPRTELPTEIAGPTGLWMLNKNQLRFHFYPTLDALLAGRPSKSHTAPRRLSRTDEGTPDIVVRSGSTPADLVLDVTFHYFADLDGDRIPDADRQARGRLRGFRAWSARALPRVDALFTAATSLHAGFAAAPAGSIGDRDLVVAAGERAVLHEAQYAPHAFATWRLWLRDGTGVATALAPRTHGGSSAFGNPSVTALEGPDGTPGLLTTMFVFSEGAAPGEAGALIAFRPAHGV